MPRYIVEKDIQEVPCEHPDCERFHQRFMVRNERNDVRYHDTKRVEWIVVDSETDSQVYNSLLKKDCVREAERLNNQEKETK